MSKSLRNQCPTEFTPFSAWWTAWWDQFNKVGESDENRLEAQGWFNSLIDRAGYCARYMIPYNSQHPIFSNEPDDGLYDRKWGVRYSVTPTAKGGVKPPTGKDDAKPSTGKDDAKLQDDFALIFQNIVELGGIRRRITICTGLGPLGTWAAARFVADPALWGQLRDVHTVREDEGPIEVAIRARFIDDCRPPHLGPYQMSLSRIQILNNHPSEYLGQVCRLKKDNRRQLDGGPSIYSKVDETRHDHRVLDLGHQIRALRFLLGEDRETLTKLDPSVQNDSVDEIDEFLELIWDHVETPTAKWKELRPRCCFEKSKNNGKKNDVRLKGAIWTWDEGKKICTGPRLFTVLWELLNEVQEAGNDFQSRKLPLTPLLLRGNSGSGKEPLVEAVRWAYRWFLEQRNGSSLKPELFAEVVNVAALGSEVKTLKELLEKILTKYLSDPGVLFLDEFSDFTSINEQVSLLRLLQDGKVDVTNGDPTPHRALILAATSQPLEELTNEDVVREDLLYRFKTTWLPPLKERIIDAVFLLVFFWLEDDGWTKNDRPKTLDISLPALKLFLSHSFDGNVRLLMREIIPRLKRLYRQQGNTNPKCVNFDLMRRSLGTVGAPDTAVLEEFEETLICFSIDPPSDLKTLLEQINGGDSDQAVASQ